MYLDRKRCKLFDLNDVWRVGCLNISEFQVSVRHWPFILATIGLPPPSLSSWWVSSWCNPVQVRSVKNWVVCDSPFWQFRFSVSIRLRFVWKRIAVRRTAHAPAILLSLFPAEKINVLFSEGLISNVFPNFPLCFLCTKVDHVQDNTQVPSSGNIPYPTQPHLWRSSGVASRSCASTKQRQHPHPNPPNPISEDLLA